MSIGSPNMHIDPDIPMEQQIAFLRQRALTFQFNTFEILKEKLGKGGLNSLKTS